MHIANQQERIENIEQQCILILYGSKSGRSKQVAKQTQKHYESKGIKVTCKNMSKYNAEDLNALKRVLFVVSTYGKGESPTSARKFFDQILSSQMLQLDSLEYSVCALGDSGYKRFCQAGKDLDQRLQELGANCILSRTDCDVKFSKPAMDWIQDSCKAFLSGISESIKQVTYELETLACEETKEYTGYIIGKRKISFASNADNACYHIEIQHKEGRIAYESGDAIEVMPENPHSLVNDILRQVKISTHTLCDVSGQTIQNRLLKDFEISRLSEPVLKKYYALSQNETLGLVLQKCDKLDAYLEKSNFLDLLTDFPYALNSWELMDILPPLHGRYYSIASSPRCCSDQVHLTIKTIRFSHNNKKNEGAASVFLTEKMEINDQVRFRLHQNNNFRLPKKSKVPVVMIGIGTGIAPFRAFLQERQALGITGKSWLIWGERKSQENYYYRDELGRFQKTGILKKKDVVFSRDGEKAHVQDVILKKGDKLMKWIAKGGHLYVCGSHEMGQEVKTIINQLFSENSLPKKIKGMGFKSVDDLRDAQKYHEDLY